MADVRASALMAAGQRIHLPYCDVYMNHGPGELSSSGQLEANVIGGHMVTSCIGALQTMKIHVAGALGEACFWPFAPAVAGSIWGLGWLCGAEPGDQGDGLDGWRDHSAAVHSGVGASGVVQHLGDLRLGSAGRHQDLDAWKRHDSGARAASRVYGLLRTLADQAWPVRRGRGQRQNFELGLRAVRHASRAVGLRVHLAVGSSRGPSGVLACSPRPSTSSSSRSRRSPSPSRSCTTTTVGGPGTVSK